MEASSSQKINEHVLLVCEISNASQSTGEINRMSLDQKNKIQMIIAGGRGIGIVRTDYGTEDRRYRYRRTTVVEGREWGSKKKYHFVLVMPLYIT